MEHTILRARCQGHEHAYYPRVRRLESAAGRVPLPPFAEYPLGTIGALDAAPDAASLAGIWRRRRDLLNRAFRHVARDRSQAIKMLFANSIGERVDEVRDICFWPVDRLETEGQHQSPAPS